MKRQVFAKNFLFSLLWIFTYALYKEQYFNTIIEYDSIINVD